MKNWLMTIGTVVWMACTILLFFILLTLAISLMLSLSSDVSFAELTKGMDWLFLIGIWIYWIIWAIVLISKK